MALIAADLVPKLRVLVYNPSQEILPDEVIENIIQTWIDITGNDDKNLCDVLWNSLISLLEWLWNTDILNHHTQTGGVLSRREKVGEVEVQVAYGNGQTEYKSPWEDIYRSYLDGTFIIPGCPNARAIGGKVLIGGVDAEEICRVNSNPNSVNGLGDVASVDRHTRNVNYLRNYGPYTVYRRR